MATVFILGSLLLMLYMHKHLSHKYSITFVNVAPDLLPQGKPDQQCGYLSDNQYLSLTSCSRSGKAIGALCSKGN